LPAAAAPSLAGATTTPPSGARTELATAIAQMRPLIYERVNPLNIHNEIILSDDIPTLRKWAAKLAETPADAAQRTAKHDWISGVLLEATGNRQIIDGLHAKGKSDAPLYRADVVKGRATLEQANRLVRSAEASVGLRVSSPAYFVYCAKTTCPAG
jgi:hypothetical protein